MKASRETADSPPRNPRPTGGRGFCYYLAMTNYNCWTPEDLTATAADLEDYLEVEQDTARRNSAELQLDLIRAELDTREDAYS